MIYLHEVIDCVPGKVDAYLDLVEHGYLPYGDAQDADWLRPCGMWKPRSTYGRWSQVVFLYRIASWEKWLAYQGQRDPRTVAAYMRDFHDPALQARTGWFDRVLVALPFSPHPPARPDHARAGAQVIDQTITVAVGAIRDFIETVRDGVIPAMRAQGLTLELFARVALKPDTFTLLWSAPDTLALAQWRSRFNAKAALPNLCGLGALSRGIRCLEERDLTPVPFSPLGGVAASGEAALVGCPLPPPCQSASTSHARCSSRT